MSTWQELKEKYAHLGDATLDLSSSPEQLKQKYSKDQPEERSEEPTDRPVGQDIFGSLAEGVYRGGANLAGMPVDIAAKAMNLIPGVDITEPVGGSEWLKNLKNRFVGKYEPQSLPGRTAMAIGEQVPAMLPVGRAVSALRSAAPTTVNALSKAQLAKPIVAGIPAAVGSGLGVSAARELAPASPLAELAGAVLGGVAGGAAGLSTQKWSSFDEMAKRRLLRAAPVSRADFADPTAMKLHMKSANNAVRDMVEANRAMPGGFKFTDIDGRVVHTGLPRTVVEAAEALPQAKAYYYKQYNQLQKAAGQKELTFDGSQIGTRIKAILEAEGIPPSEYEAAPYVNKQVEKYSDPRFTNMTPQQLEDEIASVNARIKAHNRTPNPHDVSNAKIDLKIASILNEELDSGITALEGSGYKDLRNQYRNLKSIEDRLSRSAVNQLNKSVKEGLYTGADAFWLGEIGVSIASGHPAGALLGASTIGLKHGKKWYYDADRNVKALFRDADRMLPKKRPRLSDIGGAVLPPSAGIGQRPTPEPAGPISPAGRERLNVSQFGFTNEEAARILEDASMNKGKPSEWLNEESWRKAGE